MPDWPQWHGLRMRLISGTTIRYVYWRPKECVESFSVGLSGDTPLAFDVWVDVGGFKFDRLPEDRPLRIYERAVPVRSDKELGQYFAGNVEKETVALPTP